MPRKQIVQFDAASSIASTDRFLLQQGATGTAFTYGTVTQLLNGGLASTYSSVTVNGSTVPTNGIYLPASNTLGFAVNTTAEMQMTGTALSPATSDGLALGTTALMWSDAFFASGAVLNFNNGDVTLTHSAGTLAVQGQFNTNRPSTVASGSSFGIYATAAQSVAHTGTHYGAFINPTFTAASGNTLAALAGASVTAGNTSTGTVTTITGVQGVTNNASSGATTTARGVFGVPQNSSSGTITTATGGQFRVDNLSTGTITTAYGIFTSLTNSDAGGTVTNYYGAFLSTPTNSGTIVNRWGIYQQDPNSPNVFLGTVTGASFIPSSATVPTNGMYYPTTNTIGWAVNSAAEMQLTASALSPAVSDGLALGTTALMWADAFFASGAVLNFDNGDVTLTHSANQLAFAGGKLRTLYNSTDASGTTTIFTVAGDQSVAHTGNYFGADISPTFSATAGNTLAGLYGLYISPGNTSTGTVTSSFGVATSIRNVSSGTIGTTTPISGITTNSGTGTITTAYGGRFRIDQTSAGTISNAYGVYSDLINSDAGGTVTTFYGAFLATPTNSGTIVNRWGLYQQDTASPNYFGGRTLVGSTTDDGTTKLQVNGTFKVTGVSTLAALNATTGNFSGATTVNLSGTAISTVAGFVLGAAAVDGQNTAVVLDAVAVNPRHILRRANGTSASKTVLVLDDTLGAIEARGYDGSAFTTSRAGIDFVAAQNWTGAAQGGKIAFRTTANGTAVGAAVKMTLENSGALLIGGTTDDGTNKLRVSGGITVDTGNSYKVNNVAVVGATKTGWTAATGTATRTTFATTTVTTEQLAQRLKALLDDLISHGLIGT